jgi:hypothetical protein|tara:strand:- start:301 stop:900 length:600 start_codon:yes stop_codon:yes gene_type:complete
MASVTEINIGEKDNMHYYDPKENIHISLIPKQLYPVHAKTLDMRDVDVKGKYKAKVYNIVYEIAEECGQKTFLTDRGEIKGSSFVGREVYSTGVFMFLNPKVGETFEANNGANERYLRFCETIKVECPETEVDVDGEKRMVKQFPELTERDIIGKPLLGFIDIQEYVKDGETKISYKVKDFSVWADGKVKDYELADLPF